MATLSTTRNAPARPRRRGISINESIDVPTWVVDFKSFRRWARSDDFPRRGQFAYLGDHLWVSDMGEELFTHNIVKTEFTSVLASVCKKRKLGYIFSDRALLTHPKTTLSTEPDLVFASYRSVRAKKVTFARGEGDREVEISGSPDMVLEVVSKWSVRKDNVDLRLLYWLSGVGEYWLVDARSREPKFQILKRGRTGYTEVRPQAEGWTKSTVWDASFRLLTTKDEFGRPEYSVEVQ